MLNPTLFLLIIPLLLSALQSVPITLDKRSKGNPLCWTQLSVRLPLSTEGLNRNAFGCDGHSRHTGVLETHGQCLRYRARLCIVIHALRILAFSVVNIYAG